MPVALELVGRAACDDGEHDVGLDGLGDPHAGHVDERRREARRHRVGVGGAAPPEVALKQRDELGPEESSLRRELQRLLAQVGEALVEARSQEDDGLAEQQAVLRPAEGDGVDADVGRDRAQRHVERGGGVRQTGAVDVQQEAALVGEVRERCQLVGAVARPELGALRDAHDTRLDDVLVADAVQLRGDELGGELAVECRDGLELAARDPLGRPALVDVDVRAGGADDRLPRAAQRAQRQDVRGAAVEDEVRAGLLAEVLAQELLRARGPWIGAVGDGVLGVGGGDRGEHLGMRTGVVVRGKALHGPSVERAPRDRPLLLPNGCLRGRSPIFTLVAGT